MNTTDLIPFDPVEVAISAIREGRFVVVVDDTDRENEGDLIIAAEKMTAEDMAFLVRHSSGLVCASLPGARLDQLQLPLMVTANTEAHHTAFTISVDYRHGTSTGISAADRAATLRALANPEIGAKDFARPGHVFPLRYREGGVLIRPGHTEAALDLARLAGLRPAGVLCEIVNPDGSMARRPELFAFAREHRLPIISIAQLIEYRRTEELAVERVAESRLPTPHGMFTAHVYRSRRDHTDHLALTLGDPSGDDTPVRLHSECLTGDVFGSLRCDCGTQLDQAMARIAAAGRGVLLYLRGHEGRGIGLAHKLQAYALQDRGLDTVEANVTLGLPVDGRSYSIAIPILQDLGIRSVALMTNNPDKVTALETAGLRVSRRLPHESTPTPDNRHYLNTKRERLGHLLSDHMHR